MRIRNILFVIVSNLIIGFACVSFRMIPVGIYYQAASRNLSDSIVLWMLYPIFIFYATEGFLKGYTGNQNIYDKRQLRLTLLGFISSYVFVLIPLALIINNEFHIKYNLDLWGKWRIPISELSGVPTYILVAVLGSMIYFHYLLIKRRFDIPPVPLIASLIVYNAIAYYLVTVINKPFLMVFVGVLITRHIAPIFGSYLAPKSDRINHDSSTEVVGETDV